MRLRISTIAAAAGCAALLAGPALAQKSKDTLRVAANNPFPLMSQYHLPVDDASFLYQRVYESLAGYNEHTHEDVPMLASSWRRVAPDTLELELKRNVKFHNGNPFDADDVVRTLMYIADPKVKLTFKSRYSWVKEVQKLGSHKVRIVAKKPTVLDIGYLAFRIHMWDAETMDSLDRIEDYGKTAIGTGFYKAVQIDKNAGVIIERYDGYNTNRNYKRAPIKRVHALQMPDRQTQVAQLITGGVDLLRNVQPDQARDLTKNPNMRVTNISSPAIFYLALAASGVSGVEPLKDIRVRQAIFRAIDRDTLIKHLVPGGEVAVKLDALCFDSTIACKYSVKAPEYDPKEAKRLLAEAGYPNGFEMDYVVYTPMLQLGTAVANELLKIGVKMKVVPSTIGLYRRKQGHGELQAWSILFPTGSHPDAANILGVYFNGPAFQYYSDPVIRNGIDAGAAEFDLAKRAGQYEKVFNRINEQAYIYPISSIPTVFAHTKDVRIEPDLMSAGRVYAGDFFWN